MGVSVGLCAVCQGPGAMHTCMLCGRLVCSRHFHHGAGTCSMHPPGAGRGPAVHGRT